MFAKVLQALERSRERLLSLRDANGCWRGALSSSALSTATAAFALSRAGVHGALVGRALAWLRANQNADGGWGDTVRSPSNLSTTLLAWSALAVGQTGAQTRGRGDAETDVDVRDMRRDGLPFCDGERSEAQRGKPLEAVSDDEALVSSPRPHVWASTVVARAEAYICRQAGSLRGADIAAALGRRYGDDRTFCVPILMMCALAGRLGGGGARGAGILPARDAGVSPARDGGDGLASSDGLVHGTHNAGETPASRGGGGAVGEDDPWSLIPALPFEAAVLPHAALRWLRLPVVSYAMPALIAVGQAVHVHRRGGFLLSRWLRSAVAERTRAKLRRIQPESGGFLEAAPLTSFVMMALASIGQGGHPSVAAGAEFLARTVRPDGSWPIDTDLSTWVTTMAINALAAGVSGGAGVSPASPAGILPASGEDGLASSGGLAHGTHNAGETPAPRGVPASGLEGLSVAERVNLLRALLSRQLKGRHPYTDAAPGGWAWTDLSGGVPDADDTAGALVAMANLCASLENDAACGEGVPPSCLAGVSPAPSRESEAPSSACRPPSSGPMERTRGRDARATDVAALLREACGAAARGLDWLMGVQNRDGGMPTFCRGWGRLPFDRSSPDLAAHAVAAIRAWAGRVPVAGWPARATYGSVDRLGRFLERSQRLDGSWVPLWFGNELADGGENPVYGTARVLLGFSPFVPGREMCGHMAHMVLSRYWPRAYRAVEFLLSQQNDDGGWGARGGVVSSIEETAVAVEALCVAQDHWWMPKGETWEVDATLSSWPVGPLRQAVERGAAWLIDRTDGGRVFEPAPIGLYFASLWYYEQIYPVAMTVAALTRAAKLCND